MVCSHLCGNCVLFIFVEKKNQERFPFMQSGKQYSFTALSQSYMEMVHPGLGTTRAGGHITCATDPPSILHCLLKLQFTRWLHVRLSLTHWWRNKTWAWFTDGELTVWEQIKKIADAQQNDLKRQKWRRMLPTSRVAGSIYFDHIFCVEREVAVANGLATW